MPTSVKLSSALGFPQPRVLEETARALVLDPSDYWFINKESPIEPHGSELVEWWEELPISGMTPAYTLDTDPKMRKSRGRKHHLERTSYWKETATLHESDILRTVDEMRYDQHAGKKLIMGHLEEGEARLMARCEWLCAQAYQYGEIQINEEGSEEGVIRTIDYGFDSFNLVTPDVSWDDPQADIVGNLQGWIKQFRGYSKRGVRIRMNGTTAEAMMKNGTVRDLFKQSNFAGELGRDNFGKLLILLVGKDLVEVEIYDEGYFDDDGNYHEFVHDGKVLLLATPPKGKKIGSLKTTPSVANAGGGQLARPGKILGIKDMTDNKERPRYQTTHGIHCIPIIKYVKCVICATVLF